jgi:hypothetical protein
MENKPKPANKSFRENPDDLFDTEMRHKAIKGGVASYQAKLEDEDRLEILNLDESINQDHIRNRIEPPADLVSGREILRVETIKQPEGDYEKDLEKLKSLTPKQIEKLLTEIEEKSGKTFSKGDLLNGYAIDPETLESLQNVRHDGTIQLLAINIMRKLLTLGKIKDGSFNSIERRIIGGFVYLEVPGLKTPIVELWSWEFPEEDVERIANHIKKERKLLPINSHFEVL